MKTKRKKDGIIIGLVLVFALVTGTGILLLTSAAGTGGSVVVTVDGEELARYPLREERKEQIALPDGAYNILEIREGEADITEASCPDGICVKHRSISQTHQSIACLPNKVLVFIEGGAAAETDVVAE